MGNVFLVDDCDGGELLEDQPALDDQAERVHRVSASKQGPKYFFPQNVEFLTAFSQKKVAPPRHSRVAEHWPLRGVLCQRRLQEVE